MTRSHSCVLALLLASCGGANTPAQTGPDESTEDDPESFAIALRLQDAGTDEQEMPHTRVMLVRIAAADERVVVELSNETGACYHRPPPPGALIAARCWWAGHGSRYVVRRTEDAVVALRGEENEESDEVELVEVGRIDLPEGALLQVLGPDGSTSAP